MGKLKTSKRLILSILAVIGGIQGCSRQTSAVDTGCLSLIQKWNEQKAWALATIEQLHAGNLYQIYPALRGPVINEAFDRSFIDHLQERQNVLNSHQSDKEKDYAIQAGQKRLLEELQSTAPKFLADCRKAIEQKTTSIKECSNQGTKEVRDQCLMRVLFSGTDPYQALTPFALDFAKFKRDFDVAVEKKKIQDARAPAKKR